MPEDLGSALVTGLAPDQRVLISGFGDDGRGGVFALGPNGVEQLDAHETTGLAYRDGRLGRLLRAPGERTSVAELVVSDAHGVTEYRRLDAVRDPHDILDSDAGWLVVSTGTNEIVEIGGEPARLVWKGASNAPDAWHVNCLSLADGDLWASAFGRFDSFKGWRGAKAMHTGFLHNLRTGEEISGLSHPHTPRWIDGGWIVCESILSSVVRRDRTGEVVASCDAGGYTRGLARVGDVLLVGVSTRRSEEGGAAAVVAVALDTFTVVDRVSLPCLEIYDLCVVPTEIAEGVRVGFGTNAYRVARGRDDVFDGRAPARPGRSAVGDWLDPETCGCRVTADLREQVRAHESWNVVAEIRNAGDAWLASVEPHPVLVASRWIAADGSQSDGDRVPLPWVLAPGEHAQVTVPLTAPGPGTYRLSVSLVQEQNFWFDDVDPSAAASATVHVG